MGCSSSKQEVKEPDASKTADIEVAIEKEISKETTPKDPSPSRQASQPAPAPAPAKSNGKSLNFESGPTHDLSEQSAPASQKPSSDLDRRMSSPIRAAHMQHHSMQDLGAVKTTDPSKRMVQRRKTDVNAGEIERFEKFTKAKELTRKRGRLAISSETISKAKANARMAAWKEQQNKSAQVAQWLVDLLIELFMFRSFSSEQLVDLAMMMTKVEVKAGTRLIEQGELGSKFFVVHFGGFDVLVQKSPDEPPKRVAHFGPGGWFGEPALLYGSKRGATVKATKDSVVWALDREQYKWVLMAEQRKGLVADFLSGNVDWLGAQVANEVLEKIADCMQPVVYEDGQIAFRSGDTANSLMVITKGTAKYSARVGLNRDRSHNKEAEYELGVGDMVAAGTNIQESLLSLLHGQHQGGGTSKRLECLSGNSHTGSVVAVGTLQCACMSAWEFTNYLSSLPAVIGTPQGIATILRGFAIFQNCSAAEVDRVSRVLHAQRFKPDEVIIQQGTIGDHCHLLVAGEVAVTLTRGETTQHLLTLSQGEIFGERSMLTKEATTASVVAICDCVTLAISRTDFEEVLPLAMKQTLHRARSLRDSVLSGMKLGDFEPRKALGAGQWGRVLLVQHRQTKETYALKCVNRERAAKDNQQEHILQERAIMGDINHPFITQLFATFKNDTYLYMLLEVSLGGELFAYRMMSEQFTVFYSASIFLAFEHLHSHNVVYRDLKPENVLVDQHGFIKLIDFGFAKKVTHRTYTFCGTMEYIAPEVASCRGHAFPADWWTLGVLIYELLFGYTPFTNQDTIEDPLAICQNILNPNYTIPGLEVVSRETRDVLLAMLTYDPLQRPPPSEIKRQMYFNAMDWGALLRKQIDPPMVPNVTDPLDTQNFDDYELDTKYLEGKPYDNNPNNWDFGF